MENVVITFLIIFELIIVFFFWRIIKNFSDLHSYIVGNAEIQSSKAILEIYAENYEEARRILMKAKGMIKVYKDDSYSEINLDLLIKKIDLLETLRQEEKKRSIKTT